MNLLTQLKRIQNLLRVVIVCMLLQRLRIIIQLHTVTPDQFLRRIHRIRLIIQQDKTYRGTAFTG